MQLVRFVLLHTPAGYLCQNDGYPERFSRKALEIVSGKPGFEFIYNKVTVPLRRRYNNYSKYLRTVKVHINIRFIRSWILFLILNQLTQTV